MRNCAIISLPKARSGQWPERARGLQRQHAVVLRPAAGKMLLRNAIAMAAAWGATAAVGSAAGVDNSTSGMEWLASGSSAAGHEMGRKYRAACRRAATTDRAYETFKREPAYRDILEHRTYEQGRRILDRLRGVAPWLLAPRLLDVYRPVGS